MTSLSLLNLSSAIHSRPRCTDAALDGLFMHSVLVGRKHVIAESSREATQDGFPLPVVLSGSICALGLNHLFFFCLVELCPNILHKNIHLQFFFFNFFFPVLSKTCTLTYKASACDPNSHRKAGRKIHRWFCLLPEKQNWTWSWLIRCAIALHTQTACVNCRLWIQETSLLPVCLPKTRFQGCG